MDTEHVGREVEYFPQSVSKWECGIGYPDVTLFPLIAELFNVEIGVLFGRDKEETENMNLDNKKKHVSEPLHHIEFRVGNECDMDNISMIEKLKKAGIEFSHGLSNHEIKEIESSFGFRFPKEIASFLSCAYPISGGFFDYRDMSPQNIQSFHDFQKNIEESFLFDIENNASSLQAMLEPLIGLIADQEEFKAAVLASLRQSTRLIPLYAHRCFFDGMDGMPIVSFGQAVDTVYYGSDFENYLQNEFLAPYNHDNFGEISNDIKNTGIWYYIIE